MIYNNFENLILWYSGEDCIRKSLPCLWYEGFYHFDGVHKHRKKLRNYCRRASNENQLNIFNGKFDSKTWNE